MFANLRNWLDHRTGYRALLSALLIEHIPGGAKWRYVWGSCLAFVFGIQVVTGVLLMTAYSAGDSTAWASVYFIQYQMDFGWFIRGLHHFGSMTMVVLLCVHMLQVVIAGAHLPPREINWWLGLVLMGLVLAMSLTGYLLPWDQKGYWATQVATNIAGNLPVAGAWVQKIVVGGPAYGHHTLTRFYSLHVAVIPPLIVALLIAHIAVFRRHGITTPPDAEGDGWFWPDQAFRDMVVCMIVFGIMVALVLKGHAYKLETPAVEAAAESAPSLYERWAHAGRDGLGANLDAPADPAQAYPARPETYFLFLFQLLKYFEGDQEIVGTVVIPQAVGILLFLLPLFGYGRLRPLGHILGVLVVVAFLTGAGMLTYLAVADDMVNPLARAVVVKVLATGFVPLSAVVLVLWLGMLSILRRGAFRAAVALTGGLLLLVLFAAMGLLNYVVLDADQKYVAAIRENSEGKPISPDFNQFNDPRVPKQATDWVVQRMTEEEKQPLTKAVKFQDELTRAGQSAQRALALAEDGVPAAGPVLLLRHDPRTRGRELFGQCCATCHTYGKEFTNNEPTASNLEGFGTEDWIKGLLKKPDSLSYFGGTKLRGMTKFVAEAREKAKDAGTEKELDADFDRIAAWLAGHPTAEIPKEGDSSDFAKGYFAYKNQCGRCHGYRPAEDDKPKKGPDFTGYGDADWLRLMIMYPCHDLRYGSNNAMPAFRDTEGPGGEVMKHGLNRIKKLLSDKIQGDDDKAKLERQKIENAHKLVHLSDIERELIIRFILKDYRLVHGGEPIASPPGR